MPAAPWCGAPLVRPSCKREMCLKKKVNFLYDGWEMHWDGSIHDILELNDDWAGAYRTTEITLEIKRHNFFPRELTLPLLLLSHEIW